MDRTQKLTIGALVIFILLLGGFLGWQIKHKKSKTSNQTSSQNSGTPSSTDKMKELLTWPAPNATDAEKTAHDKLVGSYATAGTKITINNCTPDPLVLLQKINQQFDFINSGSKDLIVTIDADHVLTLKAGKTIQVKDNFKFGKGTYGYTCKDASNTNIGPLSGYIILAE
jgi:hypothetical protein